MVSGWPPEKFPRRQFTPRNLSPREIPPLPENSPRGQFSSENNELPKRKKDKWNEWRREVIVECSNHNPKYKQNDAEYPIEFIFILLFLLILFSCFWESVYHSRVRKRLKK